MERAMTSTHSNSTISTRIAATTAVFLVMLMVAACSTDKPLPDFGSIDFRETRYQDVSALRSFRDCRSQAVELDGQARVDVVDQQRAVGVELDERAHPRRVVEGEDERRAIEEGGVVRRREAGGPEQDHQAARRPPIQ